MLCEGVAWPGATFGTGKQPKEQSMRDRLRWERRLPRGEINYAFHILPRRKLIYINNPKAACSTLKATLWQWETGNRVEAFASMQVHRKKGSPFKSPSDFGFEQFMDDMDSLGYTRMSFVRNPYYRLLSGYLDKIRKTGGPVVSVFREKLSLPLDRDVAFAEFVERVESQTPYEADRHWRVQTEQLLWGDIHYDFVGRVESFMEHLDRLGKERGVCLMGYFHDRNQRSKDTHLLLGQFYTEDLRSRAYDLYRADFDAFGYDEALRDLDGNAIALT